MQTVLSTPDKGVGIVLLNKTDYVAKMEAILNDKLEFAKMTAGNHKRYQTEKIISQ